MAFIFGMCVPLTRPFNWYKKLCPSICLSVCHALLALAPHVYSGTLVLFYYVPWNGMRGASSFCPVYLSVAKLL